MPRSVISNSVLFTGAMFALVAVAPAAPPATPAAKKITPGKVVVPVGKGEQRLIFGELLALDPQTQTGSFRNENNGEITPFNVLPYAVLQHYAAFGEMQDFRVGERALFRLHQDENGKWTWLTYIGDEVSFLANHFSFCWVDSVDPAAGQISFTRANADKTSVGEKGVIETDAETRFWKEGRPASFQDVKVGERFRARTHGAGKDQARRGWVIFLDDESLKRFQDEQKAVHLKRLETEGMLGYVDACNGTTLQLTVFNAAMPILKGLSADGRKVQIAPADARGKPTADPVGGQMTEIRTVKKSFPTTVTLDKEIAGLAPAQLVRVWLKD